MACLRRPRQAGALGIIGVAFLLVSAARGAAEGDQPTAQHRFDDVKYWSSVLDDPGRDAWQEPAALVAALGVANGMTIADLGAGTGYLSRRLSAAVGATGTVLAVEVEPNLLDHLRARAEREGSTNLVPILGSADNPRLPRQTVDVVLVVDTYHHIGGRVDYFRRLREAVRPGGRVAIVEWRKEPLPVGPPPDHKLEREQVVDEMGRAGYALVESPDILSYQYFLIFRPEQADVAR